jgi:hypothetical protein
MMNDLAATKQPFSIADCESPVVNMRHFFCFLAVLVAIAPSVAPAKSLTFELAPVLQVGAHGEYLAASFDFGTKFSRIESLTLSFVMPGGYEGTAMTTGNSSYLRTLATIVHDPAITVDEPFGLDPATGFTSSTFHVPAGRPHELAYGRLLAFPSGRPARQTWPDFLLAGSGIVSFIDDNRSYSHPLPAGIALGSTISWLAPNGITSARLTIIGTPVPEPAATSLLAIVAFVKAVARPKRPHVAHYRELV